MDSVITLKRRVVYIFFRMHSGAITQSAIQTGAPLPAIRPPSFSRAFELSAPSLEYTLAAASVSAGDASFCNSNMAEMYASQRVMGSAAALRMSQGQGDVPPVQRKNGYGGESAEFINYQPLAAAVGGRHMMYGGTDTYRDEFLGGFTPSSQVGITAAPVRAELVLDTVSVGLSTARGGEMVNPRPFVPLMMQPLMNLTPQSESAATRTENACRLNRMNRALVSQQLQAAASSTGLAL